MTSTATSCKAEGSDVTFYDYSSRGELLEVVLPDATEKAYQHDAVGRRVAGNAGTQQTTFFVAVARAFWPLPLVCKALWMGGLRKWAVQGSNLRPCD